MEALVETLDSGVAATIGVVLIASVLAAAWLVRWKRSVPRQINRLIRSISVDALANVIIPDGMNGEIHIDHLLLTPKGLLLLDIKDLGGPVFAGDKLDFWTAGESGNRLKFNNPLPFLQDRTAAVSELAPGLPIDSRIVFTKDAAFPKGHPDRVTTLETLGEEYQSVDAEPNHAAVPPQWETIKAAATQG